MEERISWHTHIPHLHTISGESLNQKWKKGKKRLNMVRTSQAWSHMHRQSQHSLGRARSYENSRPACLFAFSLHIYLFAWGEEHVPQHVCASQETTCRNLQEAVTLLPTTQVPVTNSGHQACQQLLSLLKYFPNPFHFLFLFSFST